MPQKAAAPGPALPGEADLSAARIDEILDARTRTLAARYAAPAARPTRALLLCRAGTERVGLPLEGVAEVFPFRPCTPVPGAPPALIGLTGRGGLLVSVLDLATALGQPAGGTAAGGHVVVLRRDGPRIGLWVERVLAVTEAVVEAEGLGRRAVAGYVDPAPTGSRQESDYGEAGFAVIDVPAVLAPLLAAGPARPV
ncbi:chemotaxis protein CheW [Methylobacterium indicum]|uniref:CheW-like domain-containing protein n=1 Tax=Methylobacterium indicum TaxID=1775910 RepID=A0A8H8WQY8_9HYPH|nr:chemotaxis protein CheW [Methylobacterium indicum]BCM82735.1 hypothetical protein mvi_11960 [Methylobacterium indicum]